MAEKFIGEWTKISDKLPDNEDVDYLCTIPFFGNNKEERYVKQYSFSKDLYELDKYDFAEFKGQKKQGFYKFDYDYGFLYAGNVIAWMPVPKAYNGKL